MSIKVNLKPYYHWLKHLADEREAYKRSHRIKQRVLSEEKDIIGLMGEMAYCIVTGETLDTKLMLKGDGGVDFQGGVQVKTSDVRKAKWLIEDIDKMGESDVYVMVLVDMGRLIGDIVGWTDFEAFTKLGCKKDFGFGERWAIEISQLRHPMDFTVIYNAVLDRHEQYGKLLNMK